MDKPVQFNKSHGTRISHYNNNPTTEAIYMHGYLIAYHPGPFEIGSFSMIPQAT